MAINEHIRVFELFKKPTTKKLQKNEAYLYDKECSCGACLIGYWSTEKLKYVSFRCSNIDCDYEVT